MTQADPFYILSQPDEFWILLFALLFSVVVALIVSGLCYYPYTMGWVC